MRCAVPIMSKNKPIFASCVDASRLLDYALDELGVEHDVRTAVFQPLIKDSDDLYPLGVFHCWIDVGSHIIDTNPRQMFGTRGEYPQVMPADNFYGWLEEVPRETYDYLRLEEVHDARGLRMSEAGQKWYKASAKKIADCVRRGKR